MKWLERAGGKAIRDIVSGVTTLPTDIYAWGAEKIGLPGAEKAAEFSEKLESGQQYILFVNIMLDFHLHLLILYRIYPL